MNAKNDYLLILNNTLIESMNKLAGMSSVCDLNIVVTFALAKVILSQWYMLDLAPTKTTICIFLQF